MTPCIRLRPVEAGLKVYSGAEGVHPDEHLCEEETEEDIPVDNICRSTTSTSLMLFVHDYTYSAISRNSESQSGWS